MLLIERYVEAVRAHLPRHQRNDIVAELREMLVSQIEAEEGKAGRRLTAEEVAAMLTGYGSPEAVAARYGAPDHLIGPAVFSQYRSIVKAILWIFCVGVPVALVTAALRSNDPLAAAARVLWTSALVLMANLTIITLIFARLDRLGGRAEPPPWDPQELVTGTERRRAIPRADAVGSMVMTTFWMLWWTDVLPINTWLLWRSLQLEAAPIWDTLTPLILSLMAGALAVNAVAALRPHWVRFYDTANLALDLGIGVMVYLALRAPALVVVSHPAAPGAGLARLFNMLLTMGLIGWAVLIVVSVAQSARSAFDGAEPPRLIA